MFGRISSPIGASTDQAIFWPESTIMRTTAWWWRSTPKPHHPTIADWLLCIFIDDARSLGPEVAPINPNHHRLRWWFFDSQIRPNRACGWAVPLAATAGSLKPKPYGSMVVLSKKRSVWFGGYWSGGWCLHCLCCSGDEKVKFVTWGGSRASNGVAELLHWVRSSSAYH